MFACEYPKMFEKSFFYGTPSVAVSENGWRISKGSLTQHNMYDLTNLTSQNCEIVANVSIKVSTLSSISSDLYKEILKTSKSHTNHIIQIVLCKTTLIQLEKDLYRRIYKGERFV